jgi:hypothetical protein
MPQCAQDYFNYSARINSSQLLHGVAAYRAQMLDLSIPNGFLKSIGQVELHLAEE